MRSLLHTNSKNPLGALTAAKASSFFDDAAPVTIEFTNRKLLRGFQSIFTEKNQGFSGLLRIDSNHYTDKLSFKVVDPISSGSSFASSTGSCNYMISRLPSQDEQVPYHSELRNQVKSNSQSVCLLEEKPNITFADIAGHEYIKNLIRETLILPKLVPFLFSKSRGKPRPWSKILLYGPPGVGKTMIAQAIAAEFEGSCFWASLSDLTSKFIGESEKLISLLFQMAIEQSPAIIVFDEMDSLVRKRSGRESETERRIKTAFLTQLDRLISETSDLVVIGTTNMPWEMDIAALRRFERRILVQLPDLHDRVEIFRLHAGENHMLSDEEFLQLAQLTEGYTGSDISIACNEALLKPVKMLQHATHFKPVTREYELDPEGAQYWQPCEPSSLGAVEKSLSTIDPSELLLRKVEYEDFAGSIRNCRPTVNANVNDFYLKFLSKYGHSEQKKMALGSRGKQLSYFCQFL